MKSETYSNRKEKPGRMLSGRLVFHTKYNRPMLKGGIQARAREVIEKVLEDLDCEVIKIIVQPNYVFLQFRYPPKLAMSKIANKVKGISSCLLRREFPDLKKQNPKALWAPKYCVYPKDAINPTSGSICTSQPHRVPVPRFRESRIAPTDPFCTT